MNPLLRIYRALLNSFGPQGWWPVTPPGHSIPVYDKGPRTSRQQLEVIFGAILTQNTAWKNVEKAIIALNNNGIIDSKKILRMRKNKLAQLIRQSGYYNQKAIKLREFCSHLKKRYGHNLRLMLEKPLKPLRKELLSIHGIGPETADSILLYAAGKPSFVIDAYTKRIISRYGLCSHDVSYEDLKLLFEKSLRKDAKLFNEYHALLVRLGKDFCMSKEPKCHVCPINKGCQRKLINAGKKHKAVELYKMKQVSLGLGAKLAEVSLSEFIDLLKEHNITLNLERGDVQRALDTARKVF